MNLSSQIKFKYHIIHIIGIMSSIKRKIRKPCLMPRHKGLCMEWLRKSMAEVIKTVLLSDRTMQEDDLRLCHEKIGKLWLNCIFQERAVHVSWHFQFFRYAKEATDLISNYSTKIITAEPLCLRCIHIAQLLPLKTHPLLKEAPYSFL